ncbi:DUF2958 domain-containing protein [Nostoc sp. MG11]|uniref:DUF2958 domain-containing protein n=1 Tax=Nostoc sp. MG11 TaxID=2721166 RepID=UPI0018673424|nr:DUF2958 domain-containing protein [Nostoc sp. MG11]
MELLTAEIRAQLPDLGEQEGEIDPIAYVKFFMPDTKWTWYATEFDGEDTFFGLVQGLEEELGCFCLSELQKVRDSFGRQIERDVCFKPTPLSKLRRQSKVGGYYKSSDDFMITYDFNDDDSQDPTQFFNFMSQLLGSGDH